MIVLSSNACAYSLLAQSPLSIKSKLSLMRGEIKREFANVKAYKKDVYAMRAEMHAIVRAEVSVMECVMQLQLSNSLDQIWKSA